MSHPWFMNGIIYSVDVERFLDSNGDGTGDFGGMMDRLDYLSGLGVDCIWLLPFYETPNRDNGYDVADYYAVDPRLGDLGDFVRFMREARDRGIRVLIDLVVNHTSIEHRWFQEARTNADSRFRDFYIWSDEPQPGLAEQIVYAPDDIPNPWDYDDQAGQYYLHRFYDHQPDLNTANRSVRDEILKIINFWMELGVSGFRVDAAPYIGQKAAAAYGGDRHAFLKEMSDAVRSVRADGVLLAEADVDPTELAPYFGAGDEMQLLLNFSLTNYVFLALARGGAKPVERALDLLPTPPANAQWANFLRNHDELDLERLTEEEREDVYAHFAPEPSMRIYGRGIRRRLASMLHGDPRRLKLAYSLLFSLPGAPVIRYGDEIGMGDDLSLPERTSVRTPMQWSPERNAGFSSAREEDLVAPVIREGPFDHRNLNVVDQRRDPDSLLNWTERLIQVRKEAVEIAHDQWTILNTGNDDTLALRYENEGRIVICVHNLSDTVASVALDGMDDLAFALDIFGDREYNTHERTKFALDPHGYRWMKGTIDGGRREAVSTPRSQARSRNHHSRWQPVHRE